MQQVSDGLLTTDVVFCSAFVEIAKREIDSGDHVFAQRVIERAERVYAEAAEQIARAEEGSEKLRLQGKLERVRFRLDILKGQMKSLVALYSAR